MGWQLSPLELCLQVFYYCLISALPDRGCSYPEGLGEESIVKDEVNIFFRRKEYQLRYFFITGHYRPANPLNEKSRLLESCIFRQETLSVCPLFIMFLSLFCFIHNKGVRDCPRQSQRVRREALPYFLSKAETPQDPPVFIS